MNDLIAKDCAVAEIEGARAGQRIFADHETGIQHGPGRILQLVPTSAEAGVHQGCRERVARIARGARARFVVDHYKDVGHSQAGRRSRRQRPVGTGVGPGDQPREEREVDWHSGGELVVATAGASAPECAGHLNGSRVAGPGHSRCSSWLRTAAIGSGGAHLHAPAAARRAVVYCRSGRQARSGSNGTYAGVGESGDRRLDDASGRHRWSRLPPRGPRRPRLR